MKHSNLFFFKGLEYEVISDNEVRLINASHKIKKRSITIPKWVENKGKKYMVTGICKRLNHEPTYYIPYSIYGFAGSDRVRSIVLPESVSVISDSAFNCCTALQKTNIPSGVKVIPKEAFRCCHALRKIDLPSGVVKIDDLAFSGCDSLEAISIPASVTTIGYGSFMGCNALKTINIPTGVVKIGPHAFSGCKQLKTITIPSSVEIIEEGSLTSAETINILNEEGNVSIHAQAFNSSANVNYLGKRLPASFSRNDNV